MKKTSEIQKFILERTGLKTSVRKLHGAMKGYFAIRPIFQGGIYPNIPWELVQEIKTMLATSYINPSFCGIDGIEVHESNGFTNDAISMKKERKPKSIEQMKVKTWGNKNSQMRLDKATARNAKRLRDGNTARYW